MQGSVYTIINNTANMYTYMFITVLAGAEFVMTVSGVKGEFLRPVEVVMCDVCVKAFCGFIVVAYFTALGTVGNFDPPTGQ